ncbi:hypothetical protein TVAG_212410 [Trichomonas vaginalis G3]|uniref:Nucleoporin Nup54 alpha-helical domain-containing protein n=1 Tax=Trichomonas vaginalis (strain ATCC PRA-98 / G3) TaxID=412133 RepID=A2E2N1_TRIV3|nr:protein localization to nuclear inner membrane [Trichomonas vaginalis G3]EAY13059.1 hypothetical protein TVAG_212410 [Trichomonas vaginalis G3]KAI5548247.1 protein localization to nuclear inner membrane [Trichomonas vaginalis G3]|eukprot:XP_001325282.1 hypothetical protein [Trichomonas vaginalis G3]
MLSKSTPSSNLSGASTSTGTGGAKTGLLGSGGGLFGKKNQPAKPQNPIINRINALKQAYDTSSSQCKFIAIVYDAAGPSNKNSKVNLEPDIKQIADACNPDPKLYVTSIIVGYEGITSRVNVQKEMISKMQEKLQSMKNKIQELNDDFKSLLSNRIQSITEKNNEIQQMLMSVLENTEVKALSGFQLSREEQELLDELQKMQEEVNKPNQYIAALNTLSLKAKLVRDSLIVPPSYNLDASTIQKAETVLKANNTGLESISKYIKTVDRQLKFMEAAMAERDGTAPAVVESEEE